MKTRRFTLIALALLLPAGAAACSHLMMMIHGTGATPPAATEFGYGPRTSATGRYVATAEPQEPPKVRRTHAWKLTITDAAGTPVDSATIEIDGGMPQHGHGLPSRPRVTRALGSGTYVVEGMKFNMGGWWEVRFRIQAAAGPDSVVFNLDL